MDNLKKIGKNWLTHRLEAQVIKLRQANNFKIVAVCGSVGKTSTKLAIAKMLAPHFRTLYQDGNYNDRLTVPLVFFGMTEPAIFDIPGWLKVLKSARRQAAAPYAYGVVVLELGSDGPGQLADFAYLKPDIAVVTALTDEHMEYFGDLAAVAKEELAVLDFAGQALINADDSPAEYLASKQYLSYGGPGRDFSLIKTEPAAGGQNLDLNLQGESVNLSTSLIGQPGAKSVLAASAVAKLLGLSLEEIKTNVSRITAFAGRMQLLKGLNGTTLIDDSYNASPVAVKAALDVLYAMPAQHKIAILGNMNEMGKLSPEMHQDVGNYCDPAQLNLVVTIGPDANAHLAPAAKAKGCKVQSFNSPYAAGQFVKEQLAAGAAVLAKGSQNGVFAEEALKQLLANPADAAKLVRQSPEWLAKKRAQFEDAA